MGIFEFVLFGKLLYKLILVFSIFAVYLAYKLIRKYLKKRYEKNNNDGG